MNTMALPRHAAAHPPARPLVIAVINNMPDASLRATERQMCNLLGPASAGLQVELRFYSLPGIVRGAAVKSHIAAFYDDPATLHDEPPDGMIVTGAEPKTPHLRDEPFWHALANIVDLADEHGIPAIWSCLAAHAFVLHVDGVEREPLARKLTGIFEGTIDHRAHPVANRLPRTWPVPHSRRNGLSRKALERCGYTILSGSRAAGIDMFCRQTNTLQVFLQGHPEYDAETLLVEYRRDVMRAAARPDRLWPAPPVNLGTAAARAGLAALVNSMQKISRFDSAAFDRQAASLHVNNTWAPASHRLAANWLAWVDHHRDSRAPAAPAFHLHTRLGTAQPAVDPGMAQRGMVSVR